MLNIISLGAGVQSSTMALMAAHGEITPMPDCAIFADTQSEPRKVYEWLDGLEQFLPFPIHWVTGGNLEADTLGIKPTYEASGIIRTHTAKPTGSRTMLPPPFFTVQDGKFGQLTRQCTKEYKIRPLNKYMRTLAGLSSGQRVDAPVVTRWIGISLDESQRSKLSEESWAINRYPLIEKRMSRLDCLRWLDKHGYKGVTKSSCYFCPYRDDSMWRDMKLNDPLEFERAVKFDEDIRNRTQRGSTSPVFLHASRKPLKDVDFRNAEDAGQKSMFDENGFAVECEGMCGV